MGLLQKIVKNEAMKEDPPEIYGNIIKLTGGTCADKSKDGVYLHWHAQLASEECCLAGTSDPLAVLL